jgi:hypothetical protein
MKLARLTPAVAAVSVAVLGAAGPAAAQAPAQDYKSQIGMKVIHVTAHEGRGAALLSVMNGSPVTLDVEISCNFIKGGAVVVKGSGMITVRPEKAEPIEVRATRVQPFEKANCMIDTAKP